MWTKFPRLTQPNYLKAYLAVRHLTRDKALNAKGVAALIGISADTASLALRILEARELVLSERRPDRPSGTKYYWGNPDVAPYADIIFDLQRIDEQEGGLKMRPDDPKEYAAKLKEELAKHKNWTEYFVLHWYEYMTAREIAAALDVTTDEVDAALDEIALLTHDLKRTKEAY